MLAPLPDTRIHHPASLHDLTSLRGEFDRCWPWLAASLDEFGPTHSKEQVWFRICAGLAFLWPAQHGVILGEFMDYRIGARVFNYWLQGGNLDALLILHPGIEAWAKQRGCRQAVGYGRRGWVRAMHGDWRQGRTERVKWL